MKTFSKRLTKTLIALILAILMVLGTTATGFAAVVDDTASTGSGLVSLHNIFYFDNSVTKWNDSYICLCIGKSNYTSVYQMTKVTNSPNMYYFQSCDGGWSDSTYIAVIGTSSLWGAGSWGYSNCTNATHYTNQYTGDISEGSAFGIVPQSSSNGCNLALAYFGGDTTSYNTALEGMKSSATIKKKVAPYNSTTYSTDTSSVAKVTLEGRYASATGTNSWSRAYVTAVGASTPTASTSSVKYDDVIWGTDIKLQYSNLNAGYDFVGWYDSNGTQLSTSADSYTFTNYAKGNNGKGGNTDYYAYFKQKAVTVTFDENGHGTAPTSQTIAYGSAASKPTDPTATGWIFGGWYENSDCTGNAWNFSTTLTADKTIYAKWTADSYTVNISCNDTSLGSCSPIGETQIGSSPVTITASTKTGGEFVNWTTTGDVIVANPNSASTTATATGTGTIKANFKAKKYEVKYLAGSTGGTVTATSQYKTHGENLTLQSSGATKTGHHLTGWNTNSTGTGGTHYDLGATYTTDATLTLYPEFTADTYIVNYAAGTTGATGSQDSQNKTYGVALTLPDKGGFTKTGYTQTGWTTSSTGIGGTIYSLKGSYTDNEAVTLYPVFTIDTYTVSYKAGSTGATGSQASQTKTYNQALTLADKGGFTKTGYTQTGWTTNSTGSGGTTYDLKGSYTTNGPVTLYPVFEINHYTIKKSETNATGTIKINNVALTTSGVSFDYGTYTNGNRIDAPAGWKISSISGLGSWTKSSDETYATSSSISINATATLSVTYTRITYAITFNANGGSGSQAAGTKNKGEAYTLPSCTFTAPANKEFDYWALGSASGEHYNAGSAYTTDSTATFYAVWKNAGTCTLQFVNPTTSGVINATVTNTATPVNPAFHTGTITYTSSNTSVATVNSSTGLVTGLQSGTTTITATCNDEGSTSASYTYTVLAPEIEVSLTPATVTIGNTSTISYRVVANKPASGTPTISYVIGGDSGRVSRNDTILTALRDGSATVTVNYAINGKPYASNIATLTIPRPTFSVTMTPNKDNVNFGDNVSVVGSIVGNIPKDGSGTWIYESSDSTKASVEANGNVTLLAPSSDKITITAKWKTTSGTTYSPGSKSFTINTPSMSDIADVSKKVGTILTATATINNVSYDDAAVHYYSSDPTVVSVNETTGELRFMKTTNAEPRPSATITYKLYYNGAFHEEYNKTFVATSTSPSHNSTASLTTLNIGQSGTVTPSLTPSDVQLTSIGAIRHISYRLSASTPANVLSVDSQTGVYTAIKAGTAKVVMDITYDWADGSHTTWNGTGGTADITVNAPTFGFSDTSDANLLGGESITRTATSSGSTTSPTITYQSDDTTIATVDQNSGKVVAQKATGDATITATADYGNGYTLTSSYKVNVRYSATDGDIIGVDTNLLSLELGGGTTSGTVNASISGDNKGLEFGTWGYEFVSGSSVVNVSNTGSAYTVEAASVGRAVFKATYTVNANSFLMSSLPSSFTSPLGKLSLASTGADGDVVYKSSEVTVDVTQYDPNTVIYASDFNNHEWSKMFIIAWDSSNAEVVKSEMTKIAENEDGSYTYAIKLDKTDYNKITKVVFREQNDWSDSWKQTGDITTIAHGYNVLQSTDGDNKRKWQTWAIEISKPEGYIDAVSVNAGESADATLTITNSVTPSSYSWSVDDTSIATVSGSSNPATVNGLAVGTTNVNAKAYVSLSGTNYNFKSVETSDVAAYFVSSTIVGEVNVESTTLNLTASTAHNDNGSGYSKDTSDLGGTASVDPEQCEYNESATFTAEAKPGYRFVDWYNYDTETSVSTDSTYTLTGIKADTELTARFLKTYTLSVDKTLLKSYSGTADGTYDVGTNITLSGTVEDNKYLSGWTVNDVEYTGGIYETTLSSNIEASPILGSKYQILFKDTTGITITGKENYYKAGDSVNITLAPQPNYRITEVKAYTDSECTQEYTGFTVSTTGISGTMPEQNVYIKHTFTSSFTVTAQGVIRDYEDSTSTFDNNVEITPENPQIALDGGSVTFTATIKDNVKDFFQVVGWFSDSNCTKLLSTNPTYTVTPTSDMTIYPLVVRKMYGGAWNSDGTKEVTPYQLLKYDYIKSQYYLANIPYSENSGFKFFDNPNMRAENADTKWRSASLANSIGLELNRANVQDNAKFSNLVENYGSPITAWFDPAGNSGAGAIYAVASYNKATVYLSYGRYNIDEFNSISEFTDIDYSQISDEQVLKVDGSTEDIAEKYIYASLSPIRTISVETALTGYKASEYEVAAYVVYDSESNSASAVTSVSNMGNNTYAATIPVRSTCYICPVFQTKGDGQYITVDANAVSDWGPLVAAYGYTSGAQDPTNGKWPGQLMIPSADGKSYTMKISGDTDDLVINNYLASSVVNEKRKVPVGTDSHDFFYNLAGAEVKQTYDYKEFSVLKNEFTSIAYVIKNNKDAYHGDYLNGAAGTTANNVNDKTDINISKFGWDNLYKRDGVTKMTVTGEEVPASPAGTLYIVAKGDVDNHDDIGYWAVKWFVFDKDGKYLTSVYSNALYDTQGGSATNNKLVQAITAADSDLTETALKSYDVKISYEAANKGMDYPGHGTQISYDGQWYGNLSTDTVKAQVVVGEIDDGAYVPRTSEPLNVDDYGEAYITGTEDQFINVPYSDPKVSVDAIPMIGYKFAGWYLKNTDGGYEFATEALTYDTSISNNTVFYAFFEEIGEGELYVTNQKYVNQDPVDESLLSHDGPASMKIAIYEYNNGEKGNLINEGVLSQQLSSASTSVVAGQRYYIEITSTPLNKGTFYAFYTDAVTAQGEKTYEEVLTEKSDVGRTDTIVKSFIYTASENTGRTINIYTDCTKVDNTTKIVYKYIDRFGKEKTYTAVNKIEGDENYGKKIIPLTDEECKGYEGNGNNPYCPTYLTKYTLEKNGITGIVYGKKIYDQYIADGWTDKGETECSKVTNYTPSQIQADVINKEVKWDPENLDNVTIKKSLFTLVAEESDVEYTVTYNYGNVTKTEKLPYNTLLELKDVPKELDGKKFAYWVDEEKNPISPFAQYNMRVTRNKEITAVYNNSPEDIWKALIDTADVTREISDDSDMVYTDYTVHFANSLGKTLPESMSNEKIADFGVVIIQNKDQYDGKGKCSYPSSIWSETQQQTMVKTVASGDKDFRNIGGFICTRISYATSDSSYKLDELTKPFNRTVVAMGYDNTAQKAKGYNFSTYSYIRFNDGTYSISKATNVKLYDQANDSND